MKSLTSYYLIICVVILGGYLLPHGHELFPAPKVRTLNFPSVEQTFNPALPVLAPGTVPQFPAADIILQENLFAPFAVLRDQNLSEKNLSKSNLSFADLRNANLKGTNLSEALLYGSQLQGALFDSGTRLPFSSETARSLGMREER
ncbi:pentapeptide repeat-containing protein [Bdellovibrio bacteriovorus]|uniref:pentapeptide repeat-containing protein n=1 Tax=Bdellovibrio bacteriovorus TaxID=959 RepID=UPI0035A6866B